MEDRAEQWRTVLRACGADESFLRTHGGEVVPQRVAEFLMLDRLFPRSALHALTEGSGAFPTARRGTSCADLGCVILGWDIVAAVWDPGWDEPQPPRRAGEADAAGEASGGAPDDLPPPGRWYAPTTRRGKVILLITVAVILVVTVVACCVGIAGLAKLRGVDSSGLV